MNKRLEYAQHLKDREARRLSLEEAVRELLDSEEDLHLGESDNVEVSRMAIGALRKAYREVSE